MCGFAGIISAKPISTDQSILQRMADSIAHRGPDDEGIYKTETSAAPGLFFGFRRLALVDLTKAGAQPMVSGCGRYIIVYNGET